MGSDAFVEQLDALGITPKHGKQITDSALCSSCHNILLPVLNNEGKPIVVGTIDGQALTHSYEQTTGTVSVVNKAGRYLPSGVGFRRVFVEFVVEGPDGPLRASGRTNAQGVILNGTMDQVLPTEYGHNDSTAFQPHYQEITSGDQVQIYQELIKEVLLASDCRGAEGGACTAGDEKKMVTAMQ